MRKALFTTIFAISVAAPACAAESGITPAQIGQAFCLARLTGDDGAITGLLSPTLTIAISEASAKDEAWARANPGEKPPLGDGVPWASFPDVPGDCTAAPATLTAEMAEVEIRYHFPDSPSADWTDRLVLRKVEVPALLAPAWRIGDVSYSTGGSLLATLSELFPSP